MNTIKTPYGNIIDLNSKVALNWTYKNVKQHATRLTYRLTGQFKTVIDKGLILVSFETFGIDKLWILETDIVQL